MRMANILAAMAATAAITLMATPAGAIGAAVDPQIANAWVRLPAVSSRPAAGFFVAKAGSINDALVGASSPMAERVEMHSMTMTDGVMRMRAEQQFDLPMGSSLAFQPGGNHLMLFGMSADVKPGDRVPVTLEFKSGARVKVEAEARAAASGAPN